MNLRRTLLSLALAGGCIWCLAAVQKAHSQEKAAGNAGFKPVSTTELLTQVQNDELAKIKKAASADSPKFKDVQASANVVAEIFNVKGYAKDTDAAAAGEGKKAALDLAQAAKDKKPDDVKKLVDQIAPLVEKSSKGKGAENPPAYKPVSPVHPLMEVQDDHFEAIKKDVTGANHDFAALEKHALILAELSNINMHQKDKEDYKGFAQKAREQSLKLAAAAKEKNADQANSLMREIKTTCGECHDKYQ